ncbi:unnamed protein product [Notodromas monacha]|uniref:Chitin-binding type-2 domain-containing protein n=1 Tax=Notodromas monacha TaxID=399045 RepID=A0A7R9BUA2_9CRUS|nr:unnamed protein product [Notodromas monacha]CAG0921878.1 unnamed protein product [Notodromas monacha]
MLPGRKGQSWEISVDYQQDFEEDGNNEPRHFLGNDLVIATTAKPLIEADLRDNFRPFLKPHQIENHNEEQNNERFHSTRKYDEETLTPLHQFRFHEPATTVEPYITTHRNSEKLPLFGKDTRKIPRLFRKKFRLPSKVHMERRYINPLFRESLEGAESLEPVLESSPTQQAVYINEIPSSTPDYYNEISSTSNYLNEISESEFDYPRIRPSQRPLTDDRDEALLGNELGPNNNKRPGNHGFHSNEVQLVNENSGDEVNNRPQYPAYGVIPETGFNCSKQLYKGPFADINSGCQVWHYCDLDGRQSSFLCPNGTIFDQRSYTCDWWYKVRCGQSDQLYALNERLFKYRVDDPPQFPFDYHGPHVDQYILQQYFKNLQEMRQKQWGDEGRKARLKEKLREQKRKELIAKLNLELDEATYQKYGFLLRKR